MVTCLSLFDNEMNTLQQIIASKGFSLKGDLMITNADAALLLQQLYLLQHHLKANKGACKSLQVAHFVVTPVSTRVTAGQSR